MGWSTRAFCAAPEMKPLARLVATPALWPLAALIVLALVGPALAPYNPLATDVALALSPPSFAHWFGTDQLGRDILSRVLAAGRLDLAIAFAAVALSAVVGVTIGALTGYLGGALDQIVGRLTDVLMAFPLFIVAMALVAALGNTIADVVYATAIINLPFYIRVARADVRARRHALYVSASRLGGAGDEGRVRRGLDRALRLVEHAERQLGVSQGEPVAVDEARAPLLLPVDEDFAILVDLLEVEVAPVEQDLRVRLGELRARHSDVVPERAPYGRDRLVEQKRAGGALGGEPFEGGHGVSGASVVCAREDCSRKGLALARFPCTALGFQVMMALRDEPNGLGGGGYFVGAGRCPRVRQLQAAADA